LLGTDVQLGSDIDQPQLDFFAHVGEMMDRANDRIILCTAEPHWIYATIYGKVDTNANENNLALLEKRLGVNVSVFLSGDLHHYRRHAAPTGVQKITAGGGGAFLHPTHGPDASVLENDFTLKTA